MASFGLKHCCPRCKTGKLFAGVLKVAETCSHCHLPLCRHDAGDGPVFMVILLLGSLITGLAAWVEYAYSPAFWVHALLWIPLIGCGSVSLLRVATSLYITYEYTHRLKKEDNTGA